MITDDGVCRIQLHIGLFCTVSYVPGVAHLDHLLDVEFKGRKIQGVVSFTFCVPDGETTLIQRKDFKKSLGKMTFRIPRRQNIDVDTDFINYLKAEGIKVVVQRWGYSKAKKRVSDQGDYVALDGALKPIARGVSHIQADLKAVSRGCPAPTIVLDVDKKFGWYTDSEKEDI